MRNPAQQMLLCLLSLYLLSTFSLFISIGRHGEFFFTMFCETILEEILAKLHLVERNDVKIILKYAKCKNRAVKAVRIESYSFKGLEICGVCMHRVIMHVKVKQIPLLHRNKLRWKTDNAL